MIQAVAYIHDQNIVHRDIKFDNFMISNDGTLKLIDFGFAQKLEDEELIFNGYGTPSFVAPEVLYRTGCDTKSDMWSLGVMIYSLFNDMESPFKGDTDQDTYQKVLQKQLNYDNMPS